MNALNMVATEEQAELLVVGTRGRSGIAAALAGSVSTRLASESVVPVLVVGSRGRGPLRGALLGSVSASLAASAPVPVLAVPASAELIGPGGDVTAGVRAAA